MLLCLASRPAEIVAMKIVGPFPEAGHGSQYIHFIADCYSKLTRAILTSKTTATHVANGVMDHQLIPFGIPTYELNGNKTLFVSNFFATVCALLGVKYLTTAAYHPQTNDQAEVLNKTILIHLRHFVVKHKKGREISVQPLAYAYNTQVHHPTMQTSFSFVLS